MKLRTFALTVLALLLAAISAPAAETDHWRDAKEIAATSSKLAAVYAGASSALDVAIKVGQLLGWTEEGRSLEEIEARLEGYINVMYTGLSWKLDVSDLRRLHGDATVAIRHFLKGHATGADDDALLNILSQLTGPYATGLFARPYTMADVALLDLLNLYCENSRPEPTDDDYGGCVYTKADLRADLDLPAGDLVYDWQLGVPALMLFISYRIHIMAAVYPGFFHDPDRYPFEKADLIAYRDSLARHYRNIVQGIKCGKYTSHVCAEIHSSYTDATAGEKKLWTYAVHGELLLHELRSLIDTLSLYTGAPAPDLTQLYHRVPSHARPWLCLESKEGEFGWPVFMGLCNGGAAQQWVYNRTSGTVTNSGSVANPASGYCLGVTGSVVASNRLAVIASSCTGDKRQQWSYDPESGALLNALGTALTIDWGDFRTWTSPLLVTPDQIWDAEPLAAGAPFVSTLAPGDVLVPGQSRVSPSNRYELLLQTDGNLVLYEKVSGGSPGERAVALWASGTSGRDVSKLVMQTDGDLVMYAVPAPCPPRLGCDDVVLPVPQRIWASGTNRRPGATLLVGDDGHVVIYHQAVPIWRDGRRIPQIQILQGLR